MVASIVVERFDSRGKINLGPLEANITIDGFVYSGISGFGSAPVTVTIGTFGSIGQKNNGPIPEVTLTGDGERVIDNAGIIAADIQLGGGDDELNTTGKVIGSVNMGGGNDVVTLTSLQNGASYIPAQITNTLNTGSGDDVVINFGWLADVKLGSGNDLSLARSDDGSFQPYGSADRVDGGTGNDTIIGHDFDDVFIGGAGNDRIEGDDGNDVLKGGQDRDTVFGGNGQDHV